MNSNAITLVSFFLFVCCCVSFLSFIIFNFFLFLFRVEEERLERKGRTNQRKKNSNKGEKTGDKFLSDFGKLMKTIGANKNIYIKQSQIHCWRQSSVYVVRSSTYKITKKSLVLALAVFNFTLSSLQEPKSKKDRRGEQLELIRKGDTLWIRRLKINFFSFFPM